MKELFSLRTLLRLVVSLLILGTGLTLFFMLGSRGGNGQPQAAEVAADPFVDTQKVEKYERPLTIRVDGLAVPYREIEVAAEVAGRIASKDLQCRAGRFVERGRPLMQVDSSRYDLEVRRLEILVDRETDSLNEKMIELENVSALISLAENELKLHQDDLARVRGLQKVGAATQAALDEASRVVLRGRNALVVLQNRKRLSAKQKDGLENAVKVARRQLELAQLDVQLTHLSAPVDGVIVRDLVEQGSFVQKGTPLYVIEDVSQVDVLCSLRMEDLYWLWQQEGRNSADSPPSAGIQKYELPETDVSVVYSIGGQKYRWRGRLSRYDGIGLDEKTRTVRCRVSVSDPTSGEVVDSQDGQSSTPLDSLASVSGPPALVRGMFVGVLIETTPRTELLKVPEQAIYPGNVVWTVGADGWLQRRPVKIAALDGDWAIVDAARSEITVSDWVVTSPISTETTSTVVREKRQNQKDQSSE